MFEDPTLSEPEERHKKGNDNRSNTVFTCRINPTGLKQSKGHTQLHHSCIFFILHF